MTTNVVNLPRTPAETPATSGQRGICTHCALTRILRDADAALKDDPTLVRADTLQGIRDLAKEALDTMAANR